MIVLHAICCRLATMGHLLQIVCYRLVNIDTCCKIVVVDICCRLVVMNPSFKLVVADTCYRMLLRKGNEAFLYERKMKQL